jgi:hypothetical protein
VPEDRVDDAIDVLEELPGEPALADPGLAGDRDEPDPAVAGRRVEKVLEEAQLGVASDERRLEAVLATAATALGDDADRAPRGDRSGLSLEVLLVDGSNVIDVLAARWVASPTRTVPGAAADWSREAVLTRSPATIPWPIAPSVTAASPVSTPPRACSPGPSVCTASTSSSPARTARSASSSWATGAPHSAITASPMNFSTIPPCRSTTSRARSK